MATQANQEKRDSNEPRKTIRTTVDVTPDDERDAWQADSVEMSLGGMSLRANVLPEVGELLGMRFKGEPNATVSTRAEVVWAEDKGPRAGAFGVRFIDLPSGAQKSLQRMLANAVVEDVQTGVTLPQPDARVKLLIQGMDAPLRARVRTADEGEMVVGSDLSFLKLGDKVDIDGSGSKLSGVIDEVDVEVDPKTRIPRLVLTIDLGTRKKRKEFGVAPTVLAESPRFSDTESQAATAKATREPVRPVKTALVEDEYTVELNDPKPASRRAAQPTHVLGAESEDAVESGGSAELSLDDPPPGWLTQGMRGMRNVVDRVSENAGPGVRRALDAVGGLKNRVLGKGHATSTSDDDVDDDHSSRRGLRPQHPEASTDGDGEATMSQTSKRNKKVGLYAVVGLVMAAAIVAYASTSGPKVETPHPQVAVGAETTGEAQAPGTDPAVQPVEATQGDSANLNAQQPHWGTTQNPNTPDLAAAANSPNAQVEGSQPMIQYAPARPVRAPNVAVNRPMAQRPMAAPVRPMMQQRVAVQQPTQRVVIQQPTPRVAMAPQPGQQAPVRPVVFGNPSVRNGTVLRLRMDGPIAVIYGVGARGAQITLSVPGRHSLDAAAPFASQDARIARAAVLNSGAGANLTLSFREAAPPFVARSHGNVLELVLAPTPGTAPMRAGLRAMVPHGRNIR
jgi:hypothetical protein